MLVGWMNQVDEYKRTYLAAGGKEDRSGETEKDFRGIPDFEQLQLYQAGALWMLMYDSAGREALMQSDSNTKIGTQIVAAWAVCTLC